MCLRYIFLIQDEKKTIGKFTISFRGRYTGTMKAKNKAYKL